MPSSPSSRSLVRLTCLLFGALLACRSAPSVQAPRSTEIASGTAATGAGAATDASAAIGEEPVASPGFAPEPSPLDLANVPNAHLFVDWRLEEARSTPLYSALRTRLTDGHAAEREFTGATGLTEKSFLAVRITAAFGAWEGGEDLDLGPDALSWVGGVELDRPLDEQQVVALLSFVTRDDESLRVDRIEREGRSYWRVVDDRADPKTPQVHVTRVEPGRVLLFSTQVADLEHALATAWRPEVLPAPLREIRSELAGAQFQVGLALTDDLKAAMTGALDDESRPASVRQVASMLSAVRAVTLGTTIDETARLALAVRFDDAGAAARAEEQVRGLLGIAQLAAEDEAGSLLRKLRMNASPSAVSVELELNQDDVLSWLAPGEVPVATTEPAAPPPARSN